MTHRNCKNIMDKSIIYLIALGVLMGIAIADVSDPSPWHQLLQPHTAWPPAVAAQQHQWTSRMRIAELFAATTDANTQKQAAENAGNPLLASRQFPLWDSIRSEHIQPAISQLIEEEVASLELLEQDLNAAAATGSITFDRIFKPLTQITLRSDSVASQFSHLSDTVSTDALRAAVDAVTPAMVDFRLKLGQSRPIYNALKHLQNNPQLWQQLSQVQQRLVSKTITDMAVNGVGLDSQQRATFNQKRNQLEQLQNQFSNNVLDAKGAFKLLVTDKATLAGIGSTTLDLAAYNARGERHANATGASGPWLLKLDSNTYTAVMSSAHNRELRQAFYVAEKTAASSGEFDNTQIIRRILQLRQDLAAMLGYSSWGDYKSTSKMATITEATDLMQQMVKASQPAAAAEHQQLTAFAQAATNDSTFQLQWWDVEYFSERQKEQLFNLKQQELQEYLPLDHVLSGLFKLAETAYGVTISKALNQPPVWHKDVTLYQVTNTGSSTPIAYFYTDLFARPGSKSGGAWEHGIKTGSRFWLSPSPAAIRARQLPGGHKDPEFYTPKLAEAQAAWLDAAPVVLPTAIIVCNQNPPVDGKPSLMNLREVETLFHEFGHASQDMLTTSNQGLMAGIRTIELDAVEIPSMMQEKWVYDPNIFHSIARHWQTGQPLPNSMFKQIAGLHKYRQGTSFTLQLSKALTDLKLHSSYDVQTAVASPGDVYIQTLTQLAPMPPWSGDKFLNQFRHLFYYGYEAGYYSYYWADIISADIHGAFVTAGLANATAIAQVGERYRNTFLSLGGSVHPNEVFQQLMGRAPSIQAWLEYNGWK